MNGLGIIYRTQLTPAAEQSWNRVLRSDNQLLIRFAAMTPEYINTVLKSKLSVNDKFYLIFGFSPTQSSTMRGNIFEEIGSWFSNTFSQENMSNVENWLRQGSVTAQNIANALNYYHNAPTSQQIANQQQQLQNIQSQIVGTGTGIWQSYGPILTIGAIGLLAVVLISKK